MAAGYNGVNDVTHRENGGPAFPRPEAFGSGFTREKSQEGMTLRDYFAAVALRNQDIENTISYAELARRAYMIADAMIAERRK